MGHHQLSDKVDQTIQPFGAHPDGGVHHLGAADTLLYPQGLCDIRYRCGIRPYHFQPKRAAAGLFAFGQLFDLFPPSLAAADQYVAEAE
jgi:hypothetical protein